ncbi:MULTISPECIES: L-tyrosine/L-tryptophan isonitrile synthase family protein [Frankia]|uniref:L-tyrosine/L-tryptophan isonitrile synthase family protein n=1 Tax=Frankia TaxID=1854 RepID=UPI0018D40626|nr:MULTISPECIES: L-tyrosine/L-tryptophan isonitrile synthase family protein [Frankia]
MIGWLVTGYRAAHEALNDHRLGKNHALGTSDALSALIDEEGLRHLDLFSLRDILGDLPYDDKRSSVSRRYGPTSEQLRAEVRSDEDTRRLYQGITRFLVEDTAEFVGSRSALQRECRQRAYGVIGRSRAWGRLVAEHHPRAVRLSIHPQRRGTSKFGIRLLESSDAWMTPWHATVLRRADGASELMRRADAQRLGRLVTRDGRPSHFQAHAAV